MTHPENSNVERRKKPNRLVNEQSPYLRQHAYNPVDWYPWGEEALARAKAENKPILLSIGYSACHWCHVMERESFENDQIAALMNTSFIPIKVDREERPDLDQVYMDAVQMLTGRGGWPLTVFLTPAAKPFYGGTYFPPEDRQGMPGFPRVLAAISDAYRNRSEDVQQNVEKLTRAIGAMAEHAGAGGEIKPTLVESAARSLAEHYDRIHGGIGAAPKFPNSFVFSFFLRRYDADGGQNWAEMVSHTLDKMAKGGIYDQVGGGFHRYSVDDRWLVPHFEKMLYDNALLASLYIDAGRALENESFFDIARNTLDYVLREMTSPDGGFYSSQDADSEGEEGKFFVWTPGELREVLDDHLAGIATRYFDVSDNGNFEGHNILHRTIELAEAARLFKLPDDAMASAIDTIKKKLFGRREQRVKPGRDEKILAAWNALMIGAFANGYRALGDGRYLDAAVRAGHFMMTRLWDGHRLKRSFKDGMARFNAYLEDYAIAAGAMLDLYEATLDRRHLEVARTLADVMLEHFLDRDKGGFFFTSDDHEELITRSKTAFDGSTPSGSSAAVMTLLRLYGYTGAEGYLREAERALRLFAPFMEQQPFAFSHMLEAVDLYQRGPTDIVLVGESGSAEFREWIELLGRVYVPNGAIFTVDPTEVQETLVPEPARGKAQVDGKLTAYVCRERTCSAPITSLKELEEALRE